jgi:hypothetical protein
LLKVALNTKIQIQIYQLPNSLSHPGPFLNWRWRNFIADSHIAGIIFILIIKIMSDKSNNKFSLSVYFHQLSKLGLFWWKTHTHTLKYSPQKPWIQMKPNLD